MLYAAADVETAGLVGLAVLVGGAIQWGAAQLLNLRGVRRTEAKQDAADELTGLRDLNDRLEKKLDKLEAEVTAVRDKSVAQAVELSRAKVWIVMAQRFMETQGGMDGFPKYESEPPAVSEVRP